MANLDTHLLNVRNDEVHDSEISLDGFAHVGAPHLDDDFSTVTFKCSTIDNTDGGRADGRFIYGGKDLVAFFTQRLLDGFPGFFKRNALHLILKFFHLGDETLRKNILARAQE